MAEQSSRTRTGEALAVAGIIIMFISLVMLVLTLGFAAALHPVIAKLANPPTIWLGGIAFSFLIMGLGEAVTTLNDIRAATVSSVGRERLQSN